MRVAHLLPLTALTLFAAAAEARDAHVLNREWRFLLGDPAGAEAPRFDVSTWEPVHLPHTFSLPYFMWTGFYSGYGWYRREIDRPAAWDGKRVALEFEGVFQEMELYVNGQRVATHRGGYNGFSVDITDALRPGVNTLAARVNNLWRATLAPRAGDHTYSGGIYRDVRLVVTEPVHVAWYGTFVRTPGLAATRGASSPVAIDTEVVNSGKTEVRARVTSRVLSPSGAALAEVESTVTLAAGATALVRQESAPITAPALWSPATPVLHTVRTEVRLGEQLVDTYDTPFGFRWFEWTADRGFFLNGQPTYLRGANVHQDHAGWGDAVANSAHRRDVRLVKEAGFNFIRGSHYPKDPAFSEACDRLGVLLMSENCFWGIGGSHKEGGWSASAYPVTPADAPAFEESVLDSLRAMIRIHRNHPSIFAWSVSNEPFFSDNCNREVSALLRRSIDLARELDPTRPAGVGGAQRPLESDRIDRLGDFAAYNGDGATQPAFQNPGVPSLVSEYGSVVADRPGPFDPGWGDLRSQLTDGRPTQFPWRAGEAVWCMFDHGTHAGLKLARMGIVDYFRVPKRAWYWYRAQYAGVPAPAWPRDAAPEKLRFEADRTTLAPADGTEDVHLQVTLTDAAGVWVSQSRPVTLTILSGPGEFPTGRSITFTPPGAGEASDCVIREGQAAIAFRSHYAGITRVRASSAGLPDAELEIVCSGAPEFSPERFPEVRDRPYKRYQAPVAQLQSGDACALNRPTKASSSRAGAAAALANDGVATTVWRADNTAVEVTWEVFLEVAYDVQRLELQFPEPAEHAFLIEVSADGATWRTVVDERQKPRSDARRSWSGEFGKGISMVRVRFPASTTRPTPALAEVIVGGTMAGSAR